MCPGRGRGRWTEGYELQAGTGPRSPALPRAGPCWGISVGKFGSRVLPRGDPGAPWSCRPRGGRWSQLFSAHVWVSSHEACAFGPLIRTGFTVTIGSRSAPQVPGVLTWKPGPQVSFPAPQRRSPGLRAAKHCQGGRSWVSPQCEGPQHSTHLPTWRPPLTRFAPLKLAPRRGSAGGSWEEGTSGLLPAKGCVYLAPSESGSTPLSHPHTPLPRAVSLLVDPCPSLC